MVAGVDEVGRGALAGPVTVGVVLITAATPTGPRGLRDSKDLRPAARERLAPFLRRWAYASGVGHAEADEVDALGVTQALRLAAERAMAAAGRFADAVVLDGGHDYLTRSEPPPSSRRPPGVVGAGPAVVTRVRADATCTAVAAASVLAKTERDALMAARGVAVPHYRWASNAGYGAPAHLSGLREHGPCPQHRLTWALPSSTARPLPGPTPRRRAVPLGAAVHDGRDER